ncbi:MAG: tandem-95 repeat protein, partial [Magnetospirillum sp.]
SDVGNASHGMVALNGDGSVTFTPDADFNGNASFNYTISDGNGGFATKTVTVNVTPVNDAPVAVAKTASTNEDTVLTITAASLLSGATDVEGDALTLSSVGNAVGGSVSRNASGDVVFTPTANFNGTARFDYTVTDGNSGFDAKTVTMNVASINDTPVAAGASLVLPQDGVVSGILEAHDVEDGASLSFSLEGGPAHGTVSITTNGGFIYSAATGYAGSDSFRYRVSDSAGATAIGEVVVGVQALSPVAPSSLDLAPGLDGTRGFTITGAAAGDQLRAAAVAGDINGDGYADVLVAAPGMDPSARSDAGAAYVVYGKVGGFGATIDLATAMNGTTGFVIPGLVAGDGLGAVTGIGDFNGDGFDDFVVAAPGADPSGRSGAGAAYLVYGKAGGFGASLDLSIGMDGAVGQLLTGAAIDDAAGSSVSALGDINGDDLADFAITAPGADPSGRAGAGAVYVVLGKAGGIPVGGQEPVKIAMGGATVIGNLTGCGGLMTGFDGIRQTNPTSAFGSGGPGWIGVDWGGAKSVSGFKVYGTADGGFDSSCWSNCSIELYGSNGNDTATATRLGGGTAVNTGGGVFSMMAGLSAGSFSHHWVKVTSGSSYTTIAEVEFYTDPDTTSLGALGANGFTIAGATAGDGLGGAISSAGDFNGDGYDDMLVSASLADPSGRIDAGATWLVYGKAGGWHDIDLATVDAVQALKITGAAGGDASGTMVSAAGDINGDGFDDIIVTSPGADPSGRSEAGVVNVLYGATFYGTTAVTAISGTIADDILTGGAENDILNGGQGRDIYAASAGKDVIDNRGHGADDDKVLFGANIAIDQLWFQQALNDLKVSVIGTTDSVTVTGWFASNSNHISTLQTADGHTLADTAVQNLVAAMVSMTPPPIGQMTLTTQQHQQLDTVIAANWH